MGLTTVLPLTFSLGTQVGSAAQLLVSKNGVIQKPGTDYTLATGGTQISIYFSTCKWRLNFYCRNIWCSGWSYEQRFKW